MQRRWGPVRGNTGRKCPRGSLVGAAPGGRSVQTRAGEMVQTRSGRSILTREKAESRIRTPVSKRRTRSSRFETPSETITESQHEGQKIVEEQQIVQAEPQHCPEQPAERSDKLELNDQCSENAIVESNAETEEENLSEMEIHEFKQIEIIEMDEEENDGKLEETIEKDEEASDGKLEETIEKDEETNDGKLEEIIEIDEETNDGKLEETIEKDEETNDGKLEKTIEKDEKANDGKLEETIEKDEETNDGKLEETIEKDEETNDGKLEETIEKDDEASDGKLEGIIEIDDEASDGKLEDKGGDLNHKTRSETPPAIELLLSSDDDKDALDDRDNDVLLEEPSISVTPEPAALSEPAAIPPATAGSSLAKDGDLFVIDTQPGIDQGGKYYLDSSEKEESGESEEEAGDGDEESDKEDEDEEFIDEDDDDDDILKTKSSLLDSSSSIDPGLNLKELGGLYINFDAGKQGPNSKAFKKLKEKRKNYDELLANSILTPEFEKQECVPPLKESVRQLKKKRREERAKTTGDGWYNMKAPDLTDELKNDLRALKMRAAINPKRFYKKNDREGFPKYFQVGEVLDNPVDFYHSRVPKKQRKRTMVEELLADAEFRRYNKKKYQQVMAEKAALSAGKKHRKKKFRKQN